MKYVLTGLQGLAWVFLCVLVVGVAHAQTVTGSSNLSWQPVTKGCTVGVTPCDNVPLAGTSALTGYEIFVSTSSIPDNTTLQPVATAAAGATTFRYTGTVTNGQTLYFRHRAVNAYGRSALGPQTSKLITLDVLPGVPTAITVEFTIATQ